MSPEVEAAFAAANWSELTPLLLQHADNVICRKRWLGCAINAGQRPSFGGMDAQDFVSIAVDKVAQGGRIYKSEHSLRHNLEQAISSEVWNAYKKMHPGFAKMLRQKQKAAVAVDPQSEARNDPEGDSSNVPAGPQELPAADAVDPDEGEFQEGWEFPPARAGGERLPHDPEVAETRRRQQKLLDDLFDSLDGDSELERVFLELISGDQKTAEIAKATGIPAARVSELRRKLREHSERFLEGRPSDADLCIQEIKP
jgi:hypothetical protein